MIVYFWGTRGSLPTSATAAIIESKIFKAVRISRAHTLDTDGEIKKFIRDELPFSIRGGFGGNTSCVEIMGGRENIICDAGTGLRDFGNHFMKTGMKGEKKLSNVFNIFISHPHWDHIQGFPFFTPAYIPGNRINIYGCHTNLKEIFTAQQNPPFFPVPLSEMNSEIFFHIMDPGKVYDIAGMNVTCIRQNHPGGSFGYSFVKDNKKVVYSTDCEHKNDADSESYEFIEFFKNADLLIFDAQYSLLDAVDSKENWGHSSNLIGVELAVRSNVKRLSLFHSDHTYDDESLSQFLNDTREYLKIHDCSSSLEICLAYDGMEIEI
jgi:phosphoribosyl 1,2-cyclic phosphodiesterase